MVSALLALLAQALHLVLMLAAAPLLAGLVARLEARMQGRAGPPLLQAWRDIGRALARLPVVAEGTSWLLRAAPGLRLAVLVVAACLVPSFSRDMTLAPAADLLVVFGLLALARALAALGALDEGGAAAGQAASAMLARGAMAAPAVLLVVFGLALAAGGTGLAGILAVRWADAPGLLPALLPLGLALLLAAAADGGPGPTPELSGRHEALAAAGDAMRLTVWLALVAVLFLPPFLPPPRLDPAAVVGDWMVFLPVWVAKMVLLAAGLAAARSLALWPRAREVPGVLALAALLAVLGVAMLFAGQRWR